MVLNLDSVANFQGDFIDFVAKSFVRSKSTVTASLELAIVVFIIDSKGQIIDKGLMKRTRDKEINDQLFEIIDSVKSDQFEPGVLDGRNVSTIFKFLIDFSDYRFKSR